MANQHLILQRDLILPRPSQRNLIQACIRGDASLVSSLLPRTRGLPRGMDRNVIGLACTHGQDHLLPILLADSRVNPAQVLEWAVLRRWEAAIPLLLRNVEYHDFTKSLSKTCELNQFDMVHYWEDALKEPVYKVPLDTCITEFHIKVSWWICRHNPPFMTIRMANDLCLTEACYYGHLNRVREVLDVNAHRMSHVFWTHAQEIAIQKGHVEILEELWKLRRMPFCLTPLSFSAALDLAYTAKQCLMIHHLIAHYGTTAVNQRTWMRILVLACTLYEPRLVAQWIPFLNLDDRIALLSWTSQWGRIELVRIILRYIPHGSPLDARLIHVWKSKAAKASSLETTMAMAEYVCRHEWTKTCWSVARRKHGEVAFIRKGLGMVKHVWNELAKKLPDDLIYIIFTFL